MEKTHIRKLSHWYFFTTKDIDSYAFFQRAKQHYDMVFNELSKCIFDENREESRILDGDKVCEKLTIEQYLKLANLLKETKIIFNKKLGKSLLKREKP